MDSPSIQERRGIPAGELQRDTPYSASIKSHGTVSGIVGGNLHVSTSERWPEPIRIPARSGSTIRLAYMVLTWLDGFNKRFKFAVYCSDVSGAFDRVSTRKMLNKLRAKGVRRYGVFRSVARREKGCGNLRRAAGKSNAIKNMIYQGTAWLWNLFCEDAKLVLRVHDFLEVVFAEDINAFRAFPMATANEQLKTATRD